MMYKASAVGPWLGLGSSPDPGSGSGVEAERGHLGGVGDLVGVGEGLPRQGGLAEDPRPAFLKFSQQAPLGMKACRMRG
jgi:hypothetical protein